MAGDKCAITITVAATGYADKTKVVTLTLVTGELAFENDPPPSLSYSGSLQIGVDTPLTATANLPGNDDDGWEVSWEFSCGG